MLNLQVVGPRGTSSPPRRVLLGIVMAGLIFALLGLSIFAAAFVSGDGDGVDPAPDPDPDPVDRNLIQGTPEDDILMGTTGDDEIIAGEGDDRISSSLGNDLIDAGPGNDVVDAGPDDVIILGPGADALEVSLPVYSSQGDLIVTDFDPAEDKFNLSLTGTLLEPGTYEIGFDLTASEDGGATVLGTGTGPAIIFEGLSPNDLLNPDTGDLIATSVQTQIDGIVDSGESFVLFGTEYDDELAAGEDGNITLDGRSGNDRLSSFGKTNTLTGGTGNDNLWGAGAEFVIDAGEGNDHVSLSVDPSDDLTDRFGPGFDGGDTVTLGPGEDRLNLTIWPGVDYEAYTVTDFDPNEDALVITVVPASGATDPELRAESAEDGTGTLLLLDTTPLVLLQNVPLAQVVDPGTDEITAAVGLEILRF